MINLLKKDKRNIIVIRSLSELKSFYQHNDLHFLYYISDLDIIIDKISEYTNGRMFESIDFIIFHINFINNEYKVVSYDYILDEKEMSMNKAKYNVIEYVIISRIRKLKNINNLNS
jgi:hypothetical protein